MLYSQTSAAFLAIAAVLNPCTNAVPVGMAPAHEVPASLWETETMLATAPPAKMNAKSVMIVSDHGSASTAFMHNLNYHPCIVNGNEPFGGSGEHEGSPNYIHEWIHPKSTMGPLFDFETGKRTGVVANQKLAANLKKYAAMNGKQNWDLSHIDNAIAAASKGVTDSKDIAGYFDAITQHVCEKGMPDQVKQQCNNKCAVVYKLFPIYVGGRSNSAIGGGGKSTAGVDFWNDALKSITTHPNVVPVLLGRDERDRQFSVFHRFNGEGNFFDCTPGVAESNAFALAATAALPPSKYAVLDGVDCAKGKANTEKCLKKVTHAVELSYDPFVATIDAIIDESDRVHENQASPGKLLDCAAVLQSKGKYLALDKNKQTYFVTQPAELTKITTILGRFGDTTNATGVQNTV